MIIHIGFHKTGTSWLQQSLFTSASFHQPWRSKVIADEVILPNELDFDPAHARQRLMAARPNGDDRVCVLSWERLSGSAHSGGFDSALLARRLHDMFPYAQVLIGVREQRSMALALYRQYVRNGGVATAQGYFHPRHPIEIPQFSFRHLEYDRLVGRYCDYFGAENVLVLPYEVLREDPVEYARSVCRFAGVEPDIARTLDSRPINQALGDAATAMKRHVNKVYVRTSLSPGARYYVRNHEQRFERLDAWLPGLADDAVRRRWRSIVDGAIDGAVHERFRTSNTRLGSLIGRDLSTLGYATL